MIYLSDCCTICPKFTKRKDVDVVKHCPLAAEIVYDLDKAFRLYTYATLGSSEGWLW